jgi:2,3-bisphosphoglycerate-dependent phosphoglycerate mutase
LLEHLAVCPDGDDAAAERRAPSVGTLTLLRHGESEFNRSHRFTGWADVDLTVAGEREAARAGHLLRARGVTFDHCFTSALRRAARTGEIVLRAMELENVTVERSWRLNERHYGALQGLGVWSAVRRYGILPVLRARRQYAYRPPALDRDESGAPAHSRGRAASDDALPRAESLADLRTRIVPFWETRIAPELVRGRSVLVVSHKHALRALFAVLTGRDGHASSLRVSRGVPIVLTVDRALAVIQRRALRVASSR